MTKKHVKIISVTTIFLYILTITKTVFGGGIDPTQVISSTSFGGSGVGVDTLYTLGNAILGIIQYVSVGAAVVATLVLAIRYMYSSPDEKAEVKKKLIPFIIGAVLVFGATSLVKLVETFAGEMI